MFPMDLGWFAPAGDMYSTVADLTKLGNTFTQPGKQNLSQGIRKSKLSIEWKAESCFLTTFFPGYLFFPSPLSHPRGQEEERPWERGWVSNSCRKTKTNGCLFFLFVTAHRASCKTKANTSILKRNRSIHKKTFF